MELVFDIKIDVAVTPCVGCQWESCQLNTSPVSVLYGNVLSTMTSSTFSSSPKVTQGGKSKPNGMKPFSYLPSSFFPLMHTSAACRTLSNSMKTFFSLKASGSLKRFQHHVFPMNILRSPLWPPSMKLSNVSTSLNVCGVLFPNRNHRISVHTLSGHPPNTYLTKDET